MKQRYSRLCCTLFAALLMGCTTQHYTKIPMDTRYTQPRDPKNFNDYVHFLKQKAANEGISQKLLSTQHHIEFVARSIELDKQQSARRRLPNTPPPPANPNGVTRYLQKVLTPTKVKVATERWKQYQAQLAYAERSYGVPKHYILALWGMESSFGRYQGNFDVLSVLATLAFEGRREKLFTQEFVNALKILQNGTLERQAMKGSWAGAMGQTQFMPTSYLKYAADGDNDGKKDIWHNEYDAFASIARYLSSVGWAATLPWGVEVTLAAPIDLRFSGMEKAKAKNLAEWQALGIHLAYPTPRETMKLKALHSAPLWLIRPDREKGRAFLVSNNFRSLMHWNNSFQFAISIGKFADRILENVE